MQPERFQLPAHPLGTTVESRGHALPTEQQPDNCTYQVTSKDHREHRPAGVNQPYASHVYTTPEETARGIPLGHQRIRREHVSTYSTNTPPETLTITRGALPLITNPSISNPYPAQDHRFPTLPYQQTSATGQGQIPRYQTIQQVPAQQIFANSTYNPDRLQSTQQPLQHSTDWQASPMHPGGPVDRLREFSHFQQPRRQVNRSVGLNADNRVGAAYNGGRFPVQHQSHQRLGVYGSSEEHQRRSALALAAT